MEVKCMYALGAVLYSHLHYHTDSIYHIVLHGCFCLVLQAIIIVVTVAFVQVSGIYGQSWAFTQSLIKIPLVPCDILCQC